MEFCIREALVAVLEINDVKQVGFIVLEIFFINHNSYMNVLSDFKIRINELMDARKKEAVNHEMQQKDRLIKQYEKEINKLKKQILQD